MQKNSWLWRAWRTFFQGAISYLVVAVPALIDSDVSVTRKTLIGVGMAAVCWGLGALMNIKMPNPGTIIPTDVTLVSTDGEPTQEIIETDEPVIFDDEKEAIIEESQGEG